VEVVRLEHRSDPPCRVVEVAVEASEHERLARRRLREPEEHAKRGRLAGAVRAEEAGDGSRLQGEGEVVHGDDIAEPLGQRPDGDDGSAAVTE
jgi:hypothetical protein